MNLKKIWDGIKEKKTKKLECEFLFRGADYVVVYDEKVPDAVVKLDQMIAVSKGKDPARYTNSPATSIIIQDERHPSGVRPLVLYGDHRVALLMILTDLEALKKYWKDHQEDASPVCQMYEAKFSEEIKDDKPQPLGFMDFAKAA